jgi:hypothetical protein
VVAELATVLPDAQVAELPGAGHEGVDTAAEGMAAHLVGFLGAG